ncbi:MAG: hypothetical protein HY000_20800, partial [Planctomycetes bacterium]|nr:hypothetical protein [Planctomycetota bacterium]
MAIITWTGGDAANDLWSDPDNWDLGVAPVDGDDVVIPATAASAEVLFDTSVAGSVLTLNSLVCHEPFRITGDILNVNPGTPIEFTAGFTNQGGRLDLDAPTTASSLNISGGVTWGAGDFTVNGPSVWSNGGIYNSGDSPGGETFFNGTLAISGNPVLEFRELHLAGTTTWTSSVNMWQIAGGIIDILPGVAFNITHNAFMDIFAANGAERINNSGTINNNSPGETRIELPLNNQSTGVLEVVSGTFSLLALPAVFGGLPNPLNYNGSTDTLTGGTWIVRDTGSSTVTLRWSGADIVNNAANIILDGDSAVITSLTGVNALANFATNAAAGGFTIQNGK